MFRYLCVNVLDSGFLVSAKHDFQLLKAVAVGDHQLVFNIDFLHPSETEHSPKLFVDQLALGVLERPLGPEKATKSIALPSSAMFFQKPFIESYKLKSPGSSDTIDIPVLSLEGCVLSKCVSVSSAKRHRDAFDIYLALLNGSATEFADRVRPFERQNS